MGTRHQNKLVEHARDEMYRHVVRYDVLEATPPEQVDWLDLPALN